jgi:hypothetical protein
MPADACISDQIKSFHRNAEFNFNVQSEDSTRKIFSCIPNFAAYFATGELLQLATMSVFSFCLLNVTSLGYCMRVSEYRSFASIEAGYFTRVGGPEGNNKLEIEAKSLTLQRKFSFALLNSIIPR